MHSAKSTDQDGAEFRSSGKVLLFSSRDKNRPLRFVETKSVRGNTLESVRAEGSNNVITRASNRLDFCCATMVSKTGAPPSRIGVGMQITYK
jgi:hypothetical protein